MVLLLPLCLGAQGLDHSEPATASVESPGGDFRFDIGTSDMSYSITYKGEKIAWGTLGVDLSNRLMESALGIPSDEKDTWRFRSAQKGSCDTLWTPLYGENSSIRDSYSFLDLQYVKGKDTEGSSAGGYDQRRYYSMTLQVRAYDEGVAIRYHFPEQENGLFLNIRGERTTFTFPEGTMAWDSEWAQGPFHHFRVVPSDSPGEMERPMFLELPSGKKAAIGEAALVDYSRGKFTVSAPWTVSVSLYDGVEAISPYDTPWRVVMAGERSIDLVNSKDIFLNLNAPCAIADPSFVKPGKAYRCGKLERGFIMRGIEFAKNMGFQFIELDARWYGPEMSMESSALREAPSMNFTIKEVCDSARSHGLGVWVYVNQRALYRELDQILPLYREWGVSGIKFGFVQVGNQMWTTWLHDAVRKCAAYSLMVDIHDEYRPTGFSRTYPNLLTQEGIRGNEEMPSADHNVTLPFTRFLCGAADYTLCYYNSRVKNTHAHQLAMAAVYYSPLQFMFWYDDPKVYDGGAELSFWKDIPTVFDESRALYGEIGQYIVQARRSGEDWFIGAMTSLEGRKVEILLDFLPDGRYEALIYEDDPSLSTKSKVGVSSRIVSNKDVLALQLLPSGGAAIHIRPSR